LLQGLDWSPDGIHCAGCGSDMLVTIWKVTNQQPPRVLGGHSWIVHGLAWSPDGRLLASGAWDNAIRLWNAATGACVHLLRDLDHVDNNFYGVAWSPDGRLLASGSYQRVVQMWEVMAHTCLWVGHEQATRIRQVAWSPDGTRLASGGEDGSVCLWKASICTVGWLARWDRTEAKAASQAILRTTLPRTCSCSTCSRASTASSKG
jgi:WD40 repeat protein